ncbi:MAG: hypothetical protein EBZ49_07095, partial [Proteobacteria bacterium]|nr:hypothetical protein [Pseudomonadota bacterium]
MERIILLVCLVFALPAMSEPNYLKHSTTINSSIPILQRPEHATDKEEHDGGSDFICVPSDLGGYQPQRAPHGVNKKGFPPLGRKGVSKEECLRSVDNARNGVVCSHTLLGWKPTHFSGFVESRKTLGKENHGFYGVSIEGPKALETCIKATRFSTREKLCFWNGDSWLIGLVSGKTGAGGGRFKTLDTCLDAINPSWRQTALQSNLRSNSFHTVGLFSLFDSNQNGTTHSSWSPSSCNNCHDSTKYPIPDWAMSPEAFDKKLQDPKTAKEAQTWLGKLNNHLNVLRDMPPSISERENLHSSQGGKQYLNFLKDRYTSLNPVVPPLPKEPNSPDHTSSKEIQILSSKTLGHYRAMLPEVLDPEIDSILKDENTFFYDESSLPSGYQDASKSVVGVRKSGDSTFVKGAPFIDTSTKKLKVFSHGVGIDPHSSVKVFHFIRRPQRTDGTFETIKLKKTRGSDYREDGETWNWEFPVGTVSGEVLYSLDSSGEPHVLEVRTRKKSANGKNEWESNIFRPFNAEADLLLALEELKKNETFAEESHKIIET